jgi:thiol-disulfide isomerase/thioredoxin
LVKPRFRILLPAVLLAALVAGCDTQEGAEAQGGETVAEETGGETFSGFVDRTFAGDELPEVTLTDPAGATMALGEATGKPVLLNLWATWCVPCVTEMPLLDRIAGEMDGKLTVLTVSEDLEGTTAVPAFFAEKGFEHLPQWLDQNNDLAFAFGGGGSLPLTVLYDAEGKEMWRVIGAYDWESEEARALLAEAMANQ